MYLSQEQVRIYREKGRLVLDQLFDVDEVQILLDAFCRDSKIPDRHRILERDHDEVRTVVRLPEGIDPLAAMSLACAGPTPVHTFLERRPVRLGETVVIQGSGPVGLAATALDQLAGASPILLVSGPEQRLRLAAEVGIGNHHVNIVESDDTSRTLTHVIELTGGRGADLVIECMGVPAAVGQGLRLPRRGGSYLIIGQYTDSGDTTINPHQIVYRQLDVVGSWTFTGAHLVEYVRLLPALVNRFDLPRLVTTYPLLDSGSAMRDVANGSVMKAVLVS